MSDNNLNKWYFSGTSHRDRFILLPEVVYGSRAGETRWENRNNWVLGAYVVRVVSISTLFCPFQALETTFKLSSVCTSTRSVYVAYIHEHLPKIPNTSSNSAQKSASQIGPSIKMGSFDNIINDRFFLPPPHPLSLFYSEEIGAAGIE